MEHNFFFLAEISNEISPESPLYREFQVIHNTTCTQFESHLIHNHIHFFNTINCITYSRICSGPYSFPNSILHHTYKIKIKRANLHTKISHIDTYIHIHRTIHSLIFEENEANQIDCIDIYWEINGVQSNLPYLCLFDFCEGR